jgi:hypothetical protein
LALSTKGTATAATYFKKQLLLAWPGLLAACFNLKTAWTFQWGLDANCMQVPLKQQPWLGLLEWLLWVSASSAKSPFQALSSLAAHEDLLQLFLGFCLCYIMPTAAVFAWEKWQAWQLAEQLALAEQQDAAAATAAGSEAVPGFDASAPGTLGHEGSSTGNRNSNSNLVRAAGNPGSSTRASSGQGAALASNSSDSSSISNNTEQPTASSSCGWEGPEVAPAAAIAPGLAGGGVLTQPEADPVFGAGGVGPADGGQAATPEQLLEPLSFYYTSPLQRQNIVLKVCQFNAT